MKQLDIDVSPPANIMSFRLTLTHMTFDLDPNNLGPWSIWPLAKLYDPRCNIFRDMNYCPVNVGQVTDRQMEYEAYEPIVHLAQVGSNIPIHSTFLLQRECPWHCLIIFPTTCKGNSLLRWGSELVLHIVVCQSHPALVKIGQVLAPSFF